MPSHHASRRLAAAGLLVASCGVELTVPPAPEQRIAPHPVSVTPASAYAGARVVVRGEAFGTNLSDLTVTFAGTLPLTPLSVSDDGTSLELLVPESSHPGAGR